MNKYKSLINGKLVSGKEFIKEISPLDNKKEFFVPALSKDQVDLAFTSARKAFSSWKETSLKQRESLLRNWIIELHKNKQLFIDLLQEEICKKQSDAESEFNRTIKFIESTIIINKNIKPLKLDGTKDGDPKNKATFTRMPLGVIFAIAPYNYPLNLSVSKIAPALISGNTMVFKPSSIASAIGCLIGETIKNAGFPKGVFNIITGRGSVIGDHAVKNKEINLINFTGSTKIGMHIASLSGHTYKIFEMGGKDPALFLDDADINQFAPIIAKGAFSYNGQRCTAIKRVFVSKRKQKELVQAIYNEVQKYRVGSPKDNCDITPIADVRSLPFIKELINDAQNKKVKICDEVKIIDNLIYPIIMWDVKPNMRIAWEEPFAPILPIIPVKNEDEMVKLANESEYGLQASIFTKNIKKAELLANKIEAGSININQASKRSPDYYPFLGIKGSGIGVQGIEETILACTIPKGIVIKSY